MGGRYQGYRGRSTVAVPWKEVPWRYQVWGVAATEVEVDILTGEMRIVRADILEDAGLSTSPIVDIGQVEGAFVTGLGLWTRFAG